MWLPIRVTNYLRLFITGNLGWLVPAALKERRFAVLDVGENHMQDHAYFAAIDEEMDNGGREALLDYLLKFDLSQVDLRTIPKTAALLDQKIASLTPEQAWWLDVLQGGVLPGWTGPGTCVKNSLFDHYIEHAKQQGVARRVIQTVIGMFLKEYVGPELKSDQKASPGRVGRRKVELRNYMYRFPSLVDCRKRFTEKMGQEMVWDEETEWRHEEIGDEDDRPF